jgi:two-component system alkaline phosphatase synthesis response regulator PhoP
MSRILLIEDDELVGTMVRLNLQSEGFEVTWCNNGSTGLETALTSSFDLLLLDVSLPGKDGFEILKSVRAAQIGTPVMMLTARSDVDSKIGALDLGADDYLPKPFNVNEMTARVRALLRRSQAKRQHPADYLIHIGDWQIDIKSRRAKSREGEHDLGEKEVALLAYLVRADGGILSRADIIEEVWGLDAFPVERTVDNYILRLRKLFEVDPTNPVHLLTVRGVGFRFVP